MLKLRTSMIRKALSSALLCSTLSGLPGVVNADINGGIAHQAQHLGDFRNQVAALMRGDVDSIHLVVHFDFDQSKVREEDLLSLKYLSNTIQGSALIDTLTITGHTDQAGTDKYNLALSQRRIDSINRYVFQHHDPEKFSVQLRSIAYGETLPIAESSTADGRSAANRRSEILLEVAHASYHNKIDLSGNGQYLISSLPDNSALITDLLSLCAMHYLRGHTRPISVAKFSTNNRMALTGSYDQSLILWDTATGKKIHRLTGHAGKVTDVAFYGKEGAYALSASIDKSLRLWSMETGLTEQVFIGHQSGVTAVALATNKRHALSGDEQGQLIAWNPISAEVLYKLKGHQGAILDIDISYDSKMAVTVGADQQIIIWDLVKGEKLQTFAKSDSAPTYALFSENAQTVISTDESGHLNRWSAATGWLDKSVQVQGTPITSLAVSGAKHWIASGDNSTTLKLWDDNSLSYLRDISSRKSAAVPFRGQAAGEQWLHEPSKINFSWIPEGCFFIGCDANDSSCNMDRNVGQQVCVDGFWLANHEVSQQQWKAIMGSNPAKFNTNQYKPVEQVSWNDASLFMCKLNGLSDKLFRLPTEAEWEYACEQGELSPEQDEYEYESLEASLPVTESNKNALGLHGMNNNVWEWTADVYFNKGYQYLSRKQALYTGSGLYHYKGGRVDRVHRGGSWARTEAATACSARNFDGQSFKSFYIGLRPVMYPLSK